MSEEMKNEKAIAQPQFSHAINYLCDNNIEVAGLTTLQLAEILTNYKIIPDTHPQGEKPKTDEEIIEASKEIYAFIENVRTSNISDAKWLADRLKEFTDNVIAEARASECAEMEKQGYRKCAEGQGESQYCAYAEKIRAEIIEKAKEGLPTVDDNYAGQFLARLDESTIGYEGEGQRYFELRNMNFAIMLNGLLEEKFAAAIAAKEESHKAEMEAYRALTEACKTVVDGYEGDGMEGMRNRDEVFYRECKNALFLSQGKKGTENED